ncbi:AraC family transcriptional regulator ligand-binding domain-containing protein [Nocardia sp. NPDC056100]|uniref:AraC family transcriptional regulator n=1 Tax=Nocardia sp. NPDC056100 TaxID=3345712 RepID=UPI0035E20730
MPVITGTTSTRLAGLIRTTALTAGVPATELDAISPSVNPAVLADDQLRVPTEWAWRAWELIDATAGPGSGLLATAAAGHGGLHVWDYLFTCAPTLAESVRIAIGLRGVVTDPGVDWVVEVDGRLLTIRETTAIEPDGVLPPIQEFMLSIMLRRVREATGQRLVPVRVAFSHSATHRYRHLVDEFGTTRIDFGAPCAEITFLDAGDLPTGTDPYLGAMVRKYAELLLTTSRPAPDWRTTLHDTVIGALRDGDTSLEEAARRLQISPRTLQRRLYELGTSWRQEVESVRRDNAIQLMRHTDLPVQSVAARLGYTDARTLRRAIRRWSGQGVTDFRRDLRDTDSIGSPGSSGIRR